MAVLGRCGPSRVNVNGGWRTGRSGWSACCVIRSSFEVHDMRTLRGGRWSQEANQGAQLDQCPNRDDGPVLLTHGTGPKRIEHPLRHGDLRAVW